MCYKISIDMASTLSPRITFEISRLVAIHGSFARPFLQWALASDLAPAWKAYFRALQRSWQRQDQRALGEIETGLAACGSGHTLRYMLLAEKLLLLERLGRAEAATLYQQLREQFERMPPRAREIVRSSLVNYRALLDQTMDVPATRLWSKDSGRDRSALAFLYLGQARERSRAGKLAEATSLYLTSLHYSLPIPHPTGILNALNDLAWYLRRQAPAFSLSLAERAAALVGQYFEDLPSWAFVLDTLFELQAASGDPDLVLTAETLAAFLHDSPQAARRYAARLQQCERLLMDYECSRYPNDVNLQRALRRGMSTVTQAARNSGVERARISQIVNGRVREVRGDTLRRLIEGLALKPLPFRSPQPLLAEWRKSTTQERFGQSLHALAQFPTKERTVLLLSTYMAFFRRRETLPWLSRKEKLAHLIQLARQDLSQLAEEAQGRWEGRMFISLVEGAIHPVLAARRSLAAEFLRGLSEQRVEQFVSFYATQPEEDRQALDLFVRNYARYDRPWGVRLPCPEELRPLVRTLNLREDNAAISWFAFSTRASRGRFRSLLSSFPRS